MPVKRRLGKRRIDQQAELQAWSGLFKCGYDYFNELDNWGAWPATDTADQSKRAAAKAAWKRLGAAFLAEWRAGGLHGRPMAPLDTTWALSEFGEPNIAR